MKIVKPHQYFYHFRWLFLYVFYDSVIGKKIQLVYSGKKKNVLFETIRASDGISLLQSCEWQNKRASLWKICFLSSWCLCDSASTNSSLQNVCKWGLESSTRQIPAQGEHFAKGMLLLWKSQASTNKFMEITAKLKSCPLLSSASVSLVPVLTAERIWGASLRVSSIFYSSHENSS